MSIYVNRVLKDHVCVVDFDKKLTPDESGVIQQVIVDSVQITLPATKPGLTYTIVNGGYDKTVEIEIRPLSTDKIMGGGLRLLDGEMLVNKKDTASQGNYVTLIGDGSQGWYISDIVGVWQAVK